MLLRPAAETLAHGATGAWLDEFIQYGLPIMAFVILYIWSSRKEKANKAAAKERSKPK